MFGHKTQLGQSESIPSEVWNCDKEHYFLSVSFLVTWLPELSFLFCFFFFNFLYFGFLSVRAVQTTEQSQYTESDIETRERDHSTQINSEGSCQSASED